MHRSLYSIATLAFLAVTPIPALAGGLNEMIVVTERVSLKDLDLSQPKDARRALARVQRAASRVCVADGGGRLTVPNTPKVQACVAETMARSVAQLNAPLVKLALLERDRAPIVSASRR